MGEFFAYLVFFGWIFLIFLGFLWRMYLVFENHRDYKRTGNRTEQLLRSYLIRRL